MIRGVGGLLSELEVGGLVATVPPPPSPQLPSQPIVTHPSALVNSFAQLYSNGETELTVQTEQLVQRGLSVMSSKMEKEQS
jgi:hypothetical protein